MTYADHYRRIAREELARAVRLSKAAETLPTSAAADRWLTRETWRRMWYAAEAAHEVAAATGAPERETLAAYADECAEGLTAAAADIVARRNRQRAMPPCPTWSAPVAYGTH